MPLFAGPLGPKGNTRSARWDALGGGAGPAYDPDAAAYFVAMTVQPTAALKALVNSLVLGLKTGPVNGGNIWAKLGGLHLLNMHDAQAARVNARQPGTYDLTAFNSPTFTPKVGYAGNGSSAYLDANYNPSSGGVWGLNSATMFGWALKAANDNGILIGSLVGVGGYIIPRFTDGNAYTAINNGTNITVAVPTGIGCFVGSRTSAAAVAFYKDGSLIGSNTSAPAASGTSMTYLRWGSSNYYGGAMAFGGWASGLSANDVADLYSALNTFKSGVDALP